MSTIEHFIQFGGYNDFPQGWREIEANEFAQKMVRNMFEHQEYRQMHNQSNPYEPVVQGQLFFFGDCTGVAVVSRTVRDKDKGYWYKNVGEFYAFGCVHEYESINWNQDLMGPQLSCDHASKCKKCRHISIVDSSG